MHSRSGICPESPTSRVPSSLSRPVQVDMSRIEYVSGWPSCLTCVSYACSIITSTRSILIISFLRHQLQSHLSSIRGAYSTTTTTTKTTTTTTTTSQLNSSHHASFTHVFHRFVRLVYSKSGHQFEITSPSSACSDLDQLLVLDHYIPILDQRKKDYLCLRPRLDFPFFSVVFGFHFPRRAGEILS